VCDELHNNTFVWKSFVNIRVLNYSFCFQFLTTIADRLVMPKSKGEKRAHSEDEDEEHISTSHERTADSNFWLISTPARIQVS